MPFNTLARQIKSQPVKFQYWPLTGRLRVLGYLDASCRDNDDGFSQKRHDSVLGRIARAIFKGWNNVWESIVYEGQKIKKIVLHYLGSIVL